MGDIDKNSPIGVFDSGVGGLTVVKELMVAKAFELLGLDYCPSDEDNQAISEGLELFHKYFRKLWD